MIPGDAAVIKQRLVSPSGRFAVARSHSRAKLVDEYADKWGSRWLMLPNPCYGSWEGAIFGGNYRVSRSEKLVRKHGALLFDAEKTETPRRSF